MQIVWKLKDVVVRDVVDQFQEPRPAYTTIATVISVLERIYSPAQGRKR